MNKKLKSLLESYGMEINGNFAYGKIDEFETNVSVKILDNISPLRIHFSCFTNYEQKNNIQKALNDAKIKFLNARFTKFGLSVGLNDITFSRLIKRLPDVIKNVLNILRVNGAMNSQYCPVCGELLSDESKQCDIDGFKITIDMTCVAQINDLITSENEDFDQAPNNYLKGLVGAILGGLVGAAIAFILYLIGFISSISAFVAASLGSFLYKKMGGKPNKIMIVIVTITTFVLILLSVYAIYIYAASIGARENGLDISAIEAFNICMKDDEFSRLFITDMILSIFFSILGVAFHIGVMVRATRRQKNI